MRASGCLNTLGVRYAALDILPDPRIRQELSAISNWPTIPQLFVNGELVGGSDIILEMFESGELADLLGVEQPADEPEAPVHGGAGDQQQPSSPPLGLENRLS
jgi:monothiol glutaredoxin